MFKKDNGIKLLKLKKDNFSIPPKLAKRFLHWFLKDRMWEEVEGDLEEKFYHKLKSEPAWRVKLNYWYQVFNYMRPFAMKHIRFSQQQFLIMYHHYFKITKRNLIRNKSYSFINIGGLAMGISITILIGLWLNDELSYDRYHENYEQIGQVYSFTTINGQVESGESMPRPLEFILRNEYSEHFKHIIMSSWNQWHMLSYEDNSIRRTGNYMQEGAGEMLSLKMTSGIVDGLTEMHSIMLSASAAIALFEDQNPVGKIVKLDNQHDMKVSGVYEDIPRNNEFRNLGFIAPWSLYVASSEWIQSVEDVWDDSFQTYVQIQDNTDMSTVSSLIKDIPATHNEQAKEYNVQLFIHPMKDWHLKSHWENGVQTGGRIEYVWIFQIIGAFVLILACINFMNLSTARSEKRAKEIGVRKSIGSLRSQLIGQFLNESFIMVVCAWIISLTIVILLLPNFNTLTGKSIAFPWTSVPFWSAAGLLILIVVFLSGSYPALYLSAFNPVNVLKGQFKLGKGGALPRRILVVTQFTVSVALIMGTLLIFKQIQYTKNRPVGYERQGLVQVRASMDAFKGKYNYVRNQLIQSGAVEEMSGSHSPITDVFSNISGVQWEGKPDDFRDNFAHIRASQEYGKTVLWHLVQGRDFSRHHASDSSAVILNETAVRYMGIEEPVGKLIGNKHEIIGVVKDMVMQSPYQPVKQTIYSIGGPFSFYNLRLNPNLGIHEALETVESVFKDIFPDIPFEYSFIDDRYAEKFENEERIANLVGVFTVLAICISCLGLFGLASFVAEQRTKEIGIRKVMGATLSNIWRLVSHEFFILVTISCLIASPIAWIFMDDWLQQYSYRISISVETFALAILGALLLTFITVSYQTTKAARMNPVKSLRSE